MKKNLLTIIFMSAILIIISVALIIILQPRYTYVPDVVGQKVDMALHNFSEAGLEIDKEEEYSFDVPEGDIISQNVDPDTKVKEGESITIIVSKGIEKVLMPSLIGKTLDRATDMMESVELSLDCTEEYSFNITKGSIISQSIEPREKVYKKTVVAVVISKGIEPVSVPDVKGLTLNEAEAIFRTSNLEMVIVDEFSNTVPIGVVISQGSEPNSITDKKSKISVTVSAGAKNTNGNTAANIFNAGLAAQQGRWTYYLKDDNIYKTSKDSEKIYITSTSKEWFNPYLNVIGEWVYYYDNGSIYKVDINGKNKQKIINAEITGMIVTGDYIYYKNNISGFWGGNIRRVKIDGSKDTLITADDCMFFNVVGDWIYYQNDKTLYKIRTNGAQKTFIAEGYFNFINVIDNYIYMVTDIVTRLNLKNNEMVKFSESLSWVNVYNDYIYGINERHEIVRMKIDGTNKQVLRNTEDCYQDINIANGYIYYYGNSVFYKVSLDGTTKRQVL